MDSPSESGSDSWSAFQQQAAAFRRSPFRWVVLGYLCLMVVVTFVCAWAAARPYKNRAARYRSQVARLQRENATLRGQIAALPATDPRVPRLQEENRKLLEELTKLRQQPQVAAANAPLLRPRFRPFENTPLPRLPLFAPRPLPVNVRPILKGQGALPAPPTAAQGGSRPQVPSPAAAAVATVNDAGGPVTLERGGTIRGLSGVPAAVRRRVASALASHRVAVGGNPGGLSSSGSGGPAAPRSPVGVVIRTDQPVFRWTPLQGASSFVVSVTSDGGFELKSEPVSGSEWRPAKPLPRGKDYRWQVIAQGSGGDASKPAAGITARFRVLDEDSAMELDRAEQTYAALSHLTLGVLYAEYGLLDAAEQQFRALLDANPSSAVARGLLQSVRGAR